MDIRLLVNNIADALGPQADPARVEAVATAALEALNAADPSGPLNLQEPGERAIVTAFGHDKPGILAGVTNVVSGAGCNILDVSQRIMQGYFTLIMLADVSAMRQSIGELQQQLNDVGQQIGVRVMVQHEDLFEKMHRP